MKLPVKLKYNYLKDAILEVRFHSRFAEEHIPGILRTCLNDYEYVPARQLRGRISGKGSPVMSIGAGGGYFVKDGLWLKYVNDNPGSLYINMLEKYPGWKTYRNVVDEVMNKSRKAELINNITHLGLRYMSVHPIQNIFNHIRGNINLSINDEEVEPENSTVRVEDTVEIFTRIIQLANRKQRRKNEQEYEHKGLFDIDVHSSQQSKDEVDLNNPERFLEVLDRIHNIQKTTYFGLLTEEYLKSLEPEYK